MMTQSYKLLAIAPTSFYDYIRAEELIQQKVMSMSSMDDEGEEENSRLLQIHEGVAVISIKGMLTNDDSFWNRYFGMVSYNEIRQAVIQAVEQGANAAAFIYSTPGGSVDGLADTANLISMLDIPTISFTSSRMLSAGYFLGSQSDYVYADSFSDVGSVGVIIKTYDRSEYLKDMKIKPLRWRSGDLKASGDPDFKLTAKEDAYIMDKVTVTADRFFDIVSAARGMPREILDKLDITSGRTFMGSEALGVNLIDAVKTFDESMLKAYSLIKTVDNSPTSRLF
jgi:ClpP class serine protease